MLRIHQSASTQAAKDYFQEGLEKGDYYTGVEIPGYWHGRGAGLLGLSGEIDKAEFHRLCDNLRPDGTGRLTPRSVGNRRVGYDFTFNCPKSISVMHGVVGDGRIMKVFRESVGETMALIERDIHVRVRKDGKNEDRMTGNLVWGEFVHLKSRPVDGIPDPALHCHAYVFNASYDGIEETWKAGQFFYIKHDAPYYEAIFHSKLAMGLRGIGYGILNQPYGFEIEGIGRENIRRFSRRTEEIEALAEELGISADAVAKSRLGAKTRRGKQVTLTAKQIREEWRERLDTASLTFDEPSATEPLPAERAVELAIEHNFERRSVVQKRRLVANALQLSLGQCIVESIERAIENYDELLCREIGGFEHVTTKKVMEEEKSIRQFLQDTKQSRNLLAPAISERDASGLDEGQQDAIQQVLGSTDRVIVVEGRAGTGKTTMMSAAIAAIEKNGTQVFTFAPTSEAAHHVLKREGFEQSETLQQLLVNPELQSRTEGQVLWVDEAGLLSSRDMRKLVEIVERQDARLILSGDTKQHHSVDRGDALRLVAGSGLVRVASISRIYRQRRADYREAVENLARGNVNLSLAQFERMGAIKEIPDLENRLDAIVERYLGIRKRNGSVLLVAPTHQEGRLVTHRIREELQEAGLLDTQETRWKITRSRNLTAAQRKQALQYQTGDLIRFHRNSRSGFRKGEELQVREICHDGPLIVDRNGRKTSFDPRTVDHYQVYHLTEIPVAEGDLIRFSENTTTETGARLYNGSVHRIESIGSEGIFLEGDVRLPQGFHRFDHGYVSTSHASQGKTCDEVIVCQSSLSHGASSLEQFYVSVSRGRDNLAVFTDDNEFLMRGIRESGRRLLASEAFAGEQPLKTSFLKRFLDALRKQNECWAQLRGEERARGHKPHERNRETEQGRGR